MIKRRPESVLVVVYTTCSKVLLLQRADDPDFWQSVTGSLEENELPRQAADRELFEETGLVCPSMIDCQTTNQYAIREDWLHRYPPGVTHNTEHVFLAPFTQVPKVKLAADEHLSSVWLDADLAQARLWSATNRQALIDFVLPRLN